MKLINQKARITKRELKDAALGSGLIHVDENRVTGRKKAKGEQSSDQAAYMSLNKNLIDPLQKYWRFIIETKVGTHHIISLTEEGKHALHFLGGNSSGET